MSGGEMCAGRAPLASIPSHSVLEFYNGKRQPDSLWVPLRSPTRSRPAQIRPSHANHQNKGISVPLRFLTAHSRLGTKGEGVRGQNERYSDTCDWGWAEGQREWFGTENDKRHETGGEAQEITGGEGGGCGAGNERRGGGGGAGQGPGNGGGGGGRGGGSGGDGRGSNHGEGEGGDEGNNPQRSPGWLASWQVSLTAGLSASWRALHRGVSQLALAAALCVVRLSCRNLLLVVPVLIELGSGFSSLPVLWAFLKASLAAVCLLIKDLGDGHAAFAQGFSYTSPASSPGDGDGAGASPGRGRGGGASGTAGARGFGARRFRKFREFSEQQQQQQGWGEREKEEEEEWGSGWGGAQRRGTGEESRGGQSWWGQGDGQQGDFDDDLLQWLMATWLRGQMPGMGPGGRKFRSRHTSRKGRQGEGGGGNGSGEKGRKRGDMGGSATGSRTESGAGTDSGPGSGTRRPGMRQPGTMQGESEGPDWEQFQRYARSTSGSGHGGRNSYDSHQHQSQGEGRGPNERYRSEPRGEGYGPNNSSWSEPQGEDYGPSDRYWSESHEAPNTSWEEFQRHRQRQYGNADYQDQTKYSTYGSYNASQEPGSKAGQREGAGRDTCHGACERWEALSSRVLASSSQHQQQQQQREQPTGGAPPATATLAVRIRYADIPWPPLGNPLCLAQGDSPGEVRRKVREGLLRWHPDKFQALWGPHLAPCDARLTLARAARLGREVLELHRRHAARRDSHSTVQ